MKDEKKATGEVIRASAGTGKTYQLSNRFLGLVAADAPLDTILATTFTRKAAGEILGRVLSRLAETADDAGKRAELAKTLRTPLDRPRCLGLLAGHGPAAAPPPRQHAGQLLHRSRAELQPGAWPAAGLADRRRGGRRTAAGRGDPRRPAEALHRRRAPPDAPPDQGRGRAVGQPADRRPGGALYGQFLESPPEAWDSLAHKKPLAPAALEQAIEALAAVELPSDARFKKAHAAAVENARTADWIEFIGKGLAAKLSDPSGDGCFYGKPIPRRVCDAYAPLVAHARAEILGQIADQTTATRRLLEHFDAAYRELKLSRRALRFEDVTRLVGDWPLDGRFDDLAHRLDAHVSHLLLDEFQDTSPPQWRVLRPFARRAAGADGCPARRSFFCVGDVKQAIYGWRGGEAEIFDAIQRELPGLAESLLDTSYRSSQVVIDVVNRVFGGLAGQRGLAAGQVPPRGDGLGRAFPSPHHGQARACRAIAGWSRPGGPARATSRKTRPWPRCRFAADEVARLHREAPGRSIGVLVRRNATLARIIFELSARGIDASEEGGNPLSDSPAVELVLSLVTLADHPGHTAARFHVAQSPLGPLVGLDRHDDDAAACRLAGSCAAAWSTPAMARRSPPWPPGWPRTAAPATRAACCNSSRWPMPTRSAATLRPGDFATKVRNTRVEDPRGSAVRVMTVHQAKGLQFDVVVLPELDVRLSGQPPQVVVSRPGPAQPIDRVLRYVSKDVRPLLPGPMRAMFDDHDRRIIEESLCVFYVAMTRAVHALHMIVAPSAENERSLPATLAGVLRAALTDGQRLEPGKVVYEHGDAEWWRKEEGGRRKEEGGRRKAEEGKAEGTEARLSAVPPSSFLLHPSPRRPTRGLDRRSPSQLEGGAKVSLAQRLQLDSGPSLQRGTLVHAWFEQVEWLDRGEPDEKTLHDVAAALAGANQKLAAARLDVSGLLEQFHRALQAPAIRAALSRSTYENPAPRAAARPLARLRERGRG